MAVPCDFCSIRTGCDWLSGMCRLTARELPVLRPDLIKTLTKHQVFYRRHREEIREKYRESNNAAGRKYRANNRQRRLQTERNWRALHKETIGQRQREWWDKNKDAINEQRRLKRRKVNVA